MSQNISIFSLNLIKNIRFWKSSKCLPINKNKGDDIVKIDGGKFETKTEELQFVIADNKYLLTIQSKGCDSEINPLDEYQDKLENIIEIKIDPNKDDKKNVKKYIKKGIDHLYRKSEK
jgi:hypothetical protein